MRPSILASLFAFGLCLHGTRAADSGPQAHAHGPFDPATGVYQVVAGDDAGPIAGRFGLSLQQLEAQNNLSSDLIQVGQHLVVAAPAPATQPTGEPDAASESPPVALPPDPWPRQVQVGEQSLSVYQPQVEAWKDNRLSLRAAVAAKTPGKGDDAFGVIRAQARTQVDRVQRVVVLEDFEVTQADFPTLPQLAKSLGSDVAQQVAAGLRVIPLDRLEAALGAASEQAGGAVAVQNPVPRVIVTTQPAVLIPIQGSPVLKPVPDTGLQRVINTRAVIVTKGASEPYYLHLLDGWATAPTLAGPWTHASNTPTGVDAAASRLAANGEADLLNGAPSTPTLQLLAAGLPQVYVSETPAELIVFKGQPDLVPIDGTGLLWAQNTSADVIVDTADSNYYVLLAGRWYRAPSLQGPWAYVASTALPADFKRIPAGSPAAVVHAAVAGTPQAREAVIANTIPQTATVPRKGGPTFKPVFDGPATVGLLKDTQLEYVVNSETPIIRVNGETYYALEAGVWFQSASLDGPWVVADAVPDAIYAIPPSSPLHYVTYARIFGSTPEVIYEGYTPGYLGTVTAPDGVVVYGTGYDYQPWIGDTWYAAPDTFTLAAQPVYNPAVGYAYGIGLGLATAAVADSYWGGAIYRPYYAGYRCCATTSANVYSHWGDTVANGARTWYRGADGTVGTAARGDYANWRTGTTGSFAAGRSYNPWTGEAQRGYGRTFDTAGGTTGAVERGERYNPATGTRSYGSRMSATGPGGGSISRDSAGAAGPWGGSAAAHQTTLDNPRTGESHTLNTARVGNDLYAGADGHVYRNTGGGWQTHGTGGWQDLGSDGGWADREQHARSAGEDRVGAFGEGGWGDRFGGGFGDRFGGGGFGDRFGRGGLGGGGFGDRFGGGGFGGRFGGRR